MLGLRPAPDGYRYVIRFEDAQGAGPWTCGATRAYDHAQRTRNPWHAASDMPCPWSDGGDLHRHHVTKGCEGYLFAFDTVTQVRKAFRSGVGRQAMADKRGCMPKVFLVPAAEVIDGNAQVIFPRDRRDRLVALLDPRTLRVSMSYATALSEEEPA